jgi:hypothetical protein
MRKNRKNRTLINLNDLGRIKPTDISVPKEESLVELAVRLQRENNARINAPVEAAKRQQVEILRQMTKGYADFWSMPVERLQKADREARQASTPDIGLPTADYDTMTADTAAKAGQEAMKTFDTFIAGLPQRGVTLTEDGVTRLGLFVGALFNFYNAAVTLETLATALGWLWSYECFGDELHHDSPIAPAPAPESKPLSLDDVLKQGIDGSRDSDRRLREALNNDFFAETGVLAAQFIEHLQSIWNFRPDDFSWRRAFHGPNSLVVQRNWPLYDPRTFDKIRVALVNQGLWPPHLKTAGEFLDETFRKDGQWEKYRYKLNLLTQRGLVNRPMNDAKDVLSGD